MGRKHCGKGDLITPFQKACFPGASKGVIVWEWVKGEDKDRLTSYCILLVTKQPPDTEIFRKYSQCFLHFQQFFLPI